MKRVLCLLFLVGFFLCCSCAQAKPIDIWALSQWQRTEWQIEEGLPHDYVTAVTQDLDGRLIIGTKCGIVVFDGFEFKPYPVLNDVRIDSLLQSKDGTLWAGTHELGLYRIRDGRMVKVGDGSFVSLQQTEDGHLWAVSDFGAGFIHDDQFQVVVPRTQPSLPKNHPGLGGWQSIALGGGNLLWITFDQGLFRVREGRPEPVRLIGISGSPTAVYVLPDSRQLLLGTTTNLYRLSCKGSTCIGGAVHGIPGPVVGLRQAGDGTLWIATWGHGLFRVSADAGQSRVENMDSHSSLADGFVRTLYEDNENNMWIGTRGSGLTRFRMTPLKPFGTPEGVDGNCASAAIGDGEGGVWLGTWRSGLFHWSNGRMMQQKLSGDRLDVLVSALAVDSAHNLWIGTFNGLKLLPHGQGRVRTFPTTPETRSIRQIMFSHDQALWILNSGGKLNVYPSRDPDVSHPSPLLPGERVTYVLEDHAGAVWLGTATGLWFLSDAKSDPVEVYRSVSPLLSISEDQTHRIWAAFEDGSIVVRTPDGYVPFPHAGFPNRLIYKIMDDSKGDYWFSTGLGLVRVSGSDVDNALRGAGMSINVKHFGIVDGARTIECRCAQYPQPWMSARGDMWIPTAKGFVEAIPNRFPQLPSPRVSIESVEWEGAQPANGSSVKMPAGARNLEIHFSAVRLGAPEAVNFRYRLEGVDDAWVFAGQNRTAHYTQIAPGHHRFLVGARDEAGEWDNTASLDLDHHPHLYQTILFKCVSVFLTLLVIGAIYFVHLHGVQNRYRAVLEERGHIAREWHDTLLAGLSAIGWQLDAAIHVCTNPSLTTSLSSVRSMLRYCSQEARLAVDVLRMESLNPADIERMLTEAMQQLTSGTTVKFDVNVDSSASRVSGQISRNLLRICQEATTNAIRHGKASQVSVSLAHEETTLTLCVQDNGAGMSPLLVQASAPGHFGLMGMRERTLQIGGQFEIQTAPGKGTSVRVKVPMAV